MVQAAAEKEACRQNLNKIALALEGYQTKYKVYPPPVVFDRQGQPLHSWRVLILPYLDKEDEKLYSEFKLDEPWDSPHNSKLTLRMPKAYACPCDPGSFRAHTPVTWRRHRSGDGRIRCRHAGLVGSTTRKHCEDLRRRGRRFKGPLDAAARYHSCPPQASRSLPIWSISPPATQPGFRT